MGRQFIGSRFELLKVSVASPAREVCIPNDDILTCMYDVETCSSVQSSAFAFLDCLITYPFSPRRLVFSATFLLPFCLLPYAACPSALLTPQHHRAKTKDASAR